jgi:acyl-CoA thioester hydrolase
MTADTPAGKVHRLDIQMRFSDTDALGHVNNGSFVIYSEAGRLAFAGILGSGVRSLILARIAVDFRKQVVFGESIVVETWVERIGTTSVTLRQHIRANGALAAEVSSVVVSFDYAEQRPKAWSPEATAALAQYIAASN